MNNFAPLVTCKAKRTARLLKHYTVCSSAHSALFSSRTWRRTKISALWGIPLLVSLVSFFWLRRSYITNDRVCILYLFTAALWSFVGPLLIWHYETRTVRGFWRACRKLSINRSEVREARRLVHDSALARKSSICFLAAWTMVVCLAFHYSYPFVKGFGFFSRTDIWWLLGFLYVVIYSLLTGTGFLLVVQTIRMIRVLDRLRVTVDPYHPDGRGGLGFVGKLATQTVLMFASGALYLPILLRIHTSISPRSSDFVPVLVFSYAAAISLSFATPVFLVHRKLEKVKERMLSEVALRLGTTNTNPDVRTFIQDLWLRANYTDIKSMNTWPFNAENALAVISSIILPILLSVFEHHAKGK